MPTKDEFVKLYTDIIPDFPKAGYRDPSHGSLYTQGSNGYYWSSTVSGSNAFNLFFYSGGVDPAYANNRAGGFSVRTVAQ